MGNLYSRLFRYRAREKRKPIEDFLTEALTDLLERLSIEQIAEFGKSVLFRAPGGAKFWSDLLESHPKLTWSTQELVSNGSLGGIADIVMRADGEPMLIIESKVGSGVRVYDDETERADQLSLYGKWLITERRDQPAALVLLSHGTLPPDDFLGGQPGIYCVEHRGTASWPTVYRWLKRSSTDARGGNLPPDANALARDLAQFMEEIGLSTEGFTASDLAALQLFVPSADRFHATFDRMWSAGAAYTGDIFGRSHDDFEVTADGGLAWKWRMLKPPMPDKSYVAVGIRFPETAGWWSDSSLPSQPFAFVLIGAENGDLPVEGAGSLPADWQRVEDELLVAIPLHSLSIDADRRLGELEDWAANRLKEAAGLIAAMSSKTPGAL